MLETQSRTAFEAEIERFSGLLAVLSGGDEVQNLAPAVGEVWESFTGTRTVLEAGAPLEKYRVRR